jgi:hypothetical protein
LVVFWEKAIEGRMASNSAVAQRAVFIGLLSSFGKDQPATMPVEKNGCCEPSGSMRKEKGQASSPRG